MNFNNFLEKQNNIYAEFRNQSKIELEGLNPKLETNKGGYIIALRHSKSIIDAIEKFTYKVNLVVPSIIYDESNIHTTLATYEESSDFVADKDKLELISKIANDNLSFIKGLEIEYNEWLLNQDTGIITGTPNEKFVEFVDNIIKVGKTYNINLKQPWGAHITISRFLEKASYEKTLELLNVFKDSKFIGVSLPRYIDVGYFTLTKESFNINVYKRFSI